MVAVAYRRWLFTRGSNWKALTGKILVIWIRGLLTEVVTHGGLTVHWYTKKCNFSQLGTFSCSKTRIDNPLVLKLHLHATILKISSGGKKISMSDWFGFLVCKAEAVPSFLSYVKTPHEYRSLVLNSSPLALLPSVLSTELVLPNWAELVSFNYPYGNE